MSRLSLFLPALLMVAVMPPAAHADWDDPSTPVWTDSQPQQVQQPKVQPRALESEQQFFSRKHSDAEVRQYVTMRQAQLRAQQMAQQQAASMPKQALQLRPGALLPGMSTYKAPNPFAGPSDTPFFNGITPQQAYAAMSKRPYQLPKMGQSPEWAKAKYETREFQDDVEHFGNEDSMGFTK